MCGLCNLFRCGRRNGCCYNTEYETVCRRTEPRMNTYCASGIGSASNAPCGCDNDCDEYHSRCSSCERRSYDCDCDCD